MRFARLHPDTLLFRDIIEMTQQQYDALLISNPNKAALLRLLVTDPLPTINAAIEKIVVGPIVIEAAQARETWTVVPKTADELEADELEAEQSQIANRITNINEAIDEHQAILAIPYSEPPPAATNGLEITALRDRMRVAEQLLRVLERDMILTMRSTKWTMRKLRPGGGGALLNAAKAKTKNAKS